MAWPRTQAMRSALRATIAVTLVFSLLYPLGQLTITTFATFAAVTLLLFADYSGTARERLVTYASATAVSGVAVVGATLVAPAVPVAVASTFVVALAVQTSTILGGAVAKARMPVLLAWVLPVTLPSTTADALPRLAGWLIGGAVAAVAALVLWPRRDTPGLRAEIAARARFLITRLRANDSGVDGTGDGPPDGPSPLGYRPFGTTVRDHEVHRAAETLMQATWFVDDARPRPGTTDDTLHEATADALALTAALMEDEEPPPGAPTLRRLVEVRDAHLAQLVQDSADDVRAGRGAPPVLARFRAVLPLRVTGILAIEAALHAERSRQRPGPEPYLDAVPGLAPEPGPAGTIGRFLRLLGSALAPGSVWLRVSVRVAVGVSVAVAIALTTGVGHGFWVALGTLSVLRSTAFSTGRTYLQAVSGTVLGFAVSSLVVMADDAYDLPWLLWVALPVTVFLSAYAPPAWHYVAGQAAFTTFVVVMFTLLEPSGLATGLVRIEDVVIGGAVSVAVGAMLWPFGTRHRLRLEAAGLLRAATVYLSDGLVRAIDRRPAEHAGMDRDACLRAQWRTDTAQAEYAGERGGDAAAWGPVLGTAARLRLAGDLLERAADFRAPPPAPDAAAGLAPAADGVVADALLVAAELESARRLRLAGADTVDVESAERVASAAVLAWGDDTTDAVATWDTVAALWTYVWITWTHTATSGLAETLEGSPLLDHPVAVR